MNNEEFDRSKCFTFFESYYKTGNMIAEMKGKEYAYEYYKAIIEYALYEKPIEDKEMLLYAGGYTALRMIDSSQSKRARGFGENMTRTKAIIEFVRDNPGVAQSKIAEEIHCSKSTVSQVLKKFKEGKYINDFDFSIIINGTEYRPDGQVVTDEKDSEYIEVSDDGTDSGTGIYNDTDNDNDIDNDSTERYRYRSASTTDTVTVGDGLRPDVPLRCTDSRFAPGVANAPGSADATQSNMRERFNYFKSLDYDAVIPSEELPRIVAISYAELDPDIYDSIDSRREKLIKDFTSGYYKAKNKDNIIALIDAVIAGEIVERK